MWDSTLALELQEKYIFRELPCMSGCSSATAQQYVTLLMGIQYYFVYICVIFEKAAIRSQPV